MIGAIIIVFVLLIMIPVGFLMTMGGAAAGLGTLIGGEVDSRFADSEALEVSRNGHSKEVDTADSDS